MTYDSAATRRRILDAAVQEFSERGISGARVDRIAANAKANKQAIYAYFGNKEALFERVLAHVLGEVAEEVAPSPDDLPGYVERLYAYHRKHPEAMRLVMWEALEFGEREVPAEPERVERNRAKTATVAEGQRRGSVTADLDPAVLMLLVLGLSNWPAAMHAIRRTLGVDLDEDAFSEQLRTAVARLIRPD